MNGEILQTNVIIVGGGYSGMNLARILAQKGLPSQIYSMGYGASKFWGGTIDLLNYPGDNLELELAKFQVSMPDHPYARISMNDLQKALIDFEQSFSNLQLFKIDEKIRNKHIVSMLGNTKLSVGIWKTIFRDFQSFSEKDITYLINFREFRHTTSHLVAKGLGDKFQGKYEVLSISLAELFEKMNSDLIENIPNNSLTPHMLAEFFDEKSIHISPLAELVKAELQRVNPNQDIKQISRFLFPAVMGFESTQTLLSHLSTFLGVECGEYFAFSPSIMSERLMRIFERKLELLSVPIRRNCRFLSMVKQEGNYPWLCSFQTEDEIIFVESKGVVFATGSLVPEGSFSQTITMANFFHQLQFEYPESLDNHFEVIGQDSPTNVFVIGSAIFSFSTNLSDEDEVDDGTGLGLTIATSYKVAQVILRRET